MKNLTEMLHIEDVLTMEAAKTALIAAVLDHNKSTTPSEKAVLRVKAEALCEKYNELSMLNLYAQALNADSPLAFVILAHHYGIAKVTFGNTNTLDENNNLVVKVSGTVNFDGNRTVDMVAFIKWAESVNHKVTASGDWKKLTAQAKRPLEEEFRAALDANEKAEISKTKAGKALQDAFDALIFVPGKSGKNSIMPNKHVKNLVVLCGAKYTEKILEDGDVKPNMDVLPLRLWLSRVQSSLYQILSGKDLSYTFDEEDVDGVVEVKASGKKSSGKKSSGAAKAPETK